MFQHYHFTFHTVLECHAPLNDLQLDGSLWTLLKEDTRSRRVKIEFAKLVAVAYQLQPKLAQEGASGLLGAFDLSSGGHTIISRLLHGTRMLHDKLHYQAVLLESKPLYLHVALHEVPIVPAIFQLALMLEVIV